MNFLLVLDAIHHQSNRTGRLTEVVRTPHGSAGVVAEAAGVSINSKSSGDSEWIFGVVMTEATSERKEEGRRGEGGGLGNTQCQRRIADADTVVFKGAKEERERKSPKERMAGKMETG